MSRDAGEAGTDPGRLAAFQQWLSRAATAVTPVTATRKPT